MRLDKFMSDCGVLSRRETAKAVSRGEITVNGVPARRADTPIDEAHDAVCFRGEPIAFSKYVYVMMNKPSGYVSATEDGRGAPVVTDLLDEPLRKRGLFPAGRLDKDTVGFLLLTDDGALAHLLLSPKRHVAKRYVFTLDAPLPLGAEARFAEGVTLGDEVCKSAALTLTDDRTAGEILLTEGKYHQIKRMMQKEGATVQTLGRVSFAGIPLDRSLSPGAWRYLSEEEIVLLRAAPASAQENKM